MKSLIESILSTSKVGKFDEWNILKREHAHPKTRDELRIIINEAVKLKGPNVDLNWIDVSGITDMSDVFYSSEFNGDISKWNVSKVKDMEGMFNGSKFNGDISKWDVSKVKDMSLMFLGCYSLTSLDLSSFDVSNVDEMGDIISDCPSLKSLKLGKWKTAKNAVFPVSMRDLDTGINYRAGEDLPGILYHSFKYLEANNMTAKASTKTVKLKKLKKKSQVVAPITVRNAKGKLTYKVSSGNAKSKKALTLNKKTGKITVKKGVKKGDYSLKILVNDAGNYDYEPASKMVTIKVKVR